MAELYGETPGPGKGRERPAGDRCRVARPGAPGCGPMPHGPTGGA